MFAIDSLDAGITEQDLSWQEHARCNDGSGDLAELFFSEQIADINAAKAYCQECPVIEQCLAGALERREPWGVWGGQLFVNGSIVAHKRPRGRPRKHPRPEDLMVQVPVPAGLTATLETAAAGA